MGKNIRKILFFFLIILSGLFFYKNEYKQDANKEITKKIRKIEEKKIAETSAKADEAIEKAVDENTEEVKEVKPSKINEIKSLKEINPDVVGIIEIPNTEIYYPILQSSDNEYYLNHNINNEYDKNGAILLDYENDYKSSDNLVLYGHNMQNGNMFSDLVKYNDKDYLEENRDIYLYFEDRDYHYKIMSGMFLDLSNNDNDFNFNETLDFDNSYTASDYVENIQNRTNNFVSEDLKEDSKFLTLSTCTFETSNARLLVVAVLDD